MKLCYLQGCVIALLGFDVLASHQQSFAVGMSAVAFTPEKSVRSKVVVLHQTNDDQLLRVITLLRHYCLLSHFQFLGMLV